MHRHIGRDSSEQTLALSRLSNRRGPGRRFIDEKVEAKCLGDTAYHTMKILKHLGGVPSCSEQSTVHEGELLPSEDRVAVLIGFFESGTQLYHTICTPTDSQSKDTFMVYRLSY